MTETDRVELKPCPFCGGPATLGGFPRGLLGQVYCKNDDCFGSKTTAFSKSDSIKQWNTRVADAGVREALVRAIDLARKWPLKDADVLADKILSTTPAQRTEGGE